MLLPMVAADTFSQVIIDNLKYNLSGETAEVVGYSNIGDGVITIPNEVSYEGKSYYVTSIGNKAFYNCI